MEPGEEGTIDDPELLLDENGFGDHSTCTARPRESNDSRKSKSDGEKGQPDRACHNPNKTAKTKKYPQINNPQATAVELALDTGKRNIYHLSGSPEWIFRFMP